MESTHASLALLFPLCALPVAAQQSAAHFDAPLVVVGDQHRFERVFDVDGDGWADAVGFWWQDSSKTWTTISAYVNDHAGKVGETWLESQINLLDGADIGYELVTGDLSGDGRDDLAFGLSQSLTVWRSNGASVDPTEWYVYAIPAGESAQSVAMADFDADGKLDVVLATDKLRIFKNTGPTLPFVLSAALTVGLPTKDLTTGDVTGDGLPDVIVQHNGQVRVFPFDTRAGTWSGEAAFAHQIASVAGTVWGDVDGDSDGDITVFGMAGSYQVIRQVAPATWVVEPTHAGGPATNLNDVDGDGDLDGTCCGGGGGYGPLFNDGPSKFEIAHNSGDGTFDAAFGIPSLGAEHLAGVADMDHDGDADLVAGRVIYYADGPILRSPFGAALGEEIASGALADVDRDGDPDLEVGALSVQCNLGDGTLELRTPAIPAAPAGTSFVGAGFPGDWDGDGDTDLVVRHVQGATHLGMRLLENTGGGGYVDGGVASPAGWNFNIDADELDDPARSLAVDADGDGDLDLITHKVEGPQPYPAEYELASTIWFNDGTGWFAWLNPIGPEAGIVGVEDFNADGLPDLVVITDPDWRLGVQFGTGLGGYGPKVNIPQGSPGAIFEPTDPLVLADLDQDGDVDIATPSSSDYVYTFANTGFGVFAQHFVGGPDLLGFAKHSLLAADVDGDGWKDLVIGGLEHADNALAILIKNHNALGATSYQIAVKQVGDFDSLKDIHVATDLDGDGDLDLAAEDLLIMGRSYSGSGIGARLQLGSSSTGTAGMSPTLGAAGPFRLGESPTVILSGAVGGTLGLLGVGLEQALFPAFPFPDATLYLDPFDPALVVVPITTSGPLGVPGAGRLEIPVTVFSDMVGVTFNHQCFMFDAGNPSLFTATNGLLLTYGQ